MTPRIPPCDCERVVQYSIYFYSLEYANVDPIFRALSHKVMTSWEFPYFAIPPKIVYKE